MEIGIIEMAGTLIILWLIYYYFTMTFDFWKSRGIPGPEPVPLFGNIRDIILGKVSIGNYVAEEYNKYKNYPMFGIFASRAPILIINDPEIIKDVMVKNFSSFLNRGNRIFEKVEPLSANLINLEAARWKPLRTKQTTMFSSAKLKDMFYLILECASNLETTLSAKIESNDIVECCNLAARFTTDVIGRCVFGIDMNALKDENSEFCKVGLKFVNVNKWRAFKMRFKQIFPFLFKLLGPIMYDYEINDFFINTMTRTMKHRKDNNIKRGDFVDLLNDLKDNADQLKDIELTDTLLTAQAFAFFFAGFDTSSTIISHILYELALNQSIQNKVRVEINEVLINNNEKLEFTLIQEMKYLNKIFCETLRKYPVITILTRQATNAFTFSQTQTTIPKDTRIWIPVYAIHRDPAIYTNPETFNPERFDEGNMKERHTFNYLPFGAGPRNCIGARFGNYQTKIGVITILKNYRVDICDKTPIPYVSNPRRFLLAPKEGIHLKFTKLK
ncbi:PREDICTED: cytochrome P450 6A1-like [Ceratosolen solmsi marchali]|uniref:Cytochrome P450 6A1-like n=1 Tax=Ceratosolen solmsi marchali TaxID=326594 RepID=A0AAJ6YNJ8_9HYME|nr:PREDICTED: cytochrome P450 6A1-like [Ceratosolen solmsi marchali]